jgi:c-di-GMP-binding flagellar brake protein YcgR
MERRSHERIDANLAIKYYIENTLYAGTVENISENGMYFSTGNFLPCKDKLEMLIPLKEEVSTCFVKIRRIVKVNDKKLKVGVEVLNPPASYREYVQNLKSANLFNL